MSLFATRKTFMRRPASPLALSCLPCAALLLVPALLAANFAHGLDENRLWLPRAQKELRPELVQAAQLAQSSQGCEEVISGELDNERSANSAPVFLIVCRNPAGYTYSVFVTDAGKPNAKVENAQSAATIAEGLNKGNATSAAGNSAKAAVIDDKVAGEKCLAALKLRTERMTDVILQEADLKRLQSPTGGVQYELDFDAADQSGLALRFHAICRLSAGGTALIEIKPRRADASGQPRKLDKPVSPKPDAPAAPSSEPAKKADAKASTPAKDDSDKNSEKQNVTDDDGWEVVE